MPPFEVDHPHPQQPVADHGSDRAQRVPHQPGLARAGGADAEEVLAADAQQVGAAVLVFPDHHRPQVDVAASSGIGVAGTT